jgi:hypothetical protein
MSDPAALDDYASDFDEQVPTLDAPALWKNSPAEAFETLCACLSAAVTTVMHTFMRLPMASATDSILNVLEEVGSPLEEDIGNAQLLWCNTPIKDYFHDLQEDLVYLDHEHRRGSLLAQSYHELALNLTSWVLEHGEKCRAWDYVRKMRDGVSSGTNVSDHLYALTVRLDRESRRARKRHEEFLLRRVGSTLIIRGHHLELPKQPCDFLECLLQAETGLSFDDLRDKLAIDDTDHGINGRLVVCHTSNLG